MRGRLGREGEPGGEGGEGLKLKDTAAYWGYRGAAGLVHILPERLGRKVFERIGLLGWALLPNLRSLVASNQAGVIGLDAEHPSVKASTRQAFRLYARYWFDTFKAVELSDERILEGFRAEGFENMQAAADRGKGVIAVLPHLGNWDVAGRWMAIRGLPVVTVAEDLKPARLFDLFLEHRRRLRMDVVGLDEPAIVRKLAEALGSGRVVALVADRDFGGKGVPVQMFGRTRTMPAGPAALAMRTGAALMVCPVTTTRDGWLCVFHPPIDLPNTSNRRADVTSITQTIASGFEKAIAGSPADWHMFQPAWGTTPESQDVL